MSAVETLVDDICNGQSYNSSMAFIAFEGLDGAGKSSLVASLKQQLTERNIAFIFTREPGGTALAEEIRHLLLRTEGEGPVARAELLLYQAARAQHVDLCIAPALAQQQWVLCDRFTGSTYAFQKGGRDLSAEDILWLNRFATAGLEPDLNVLLDLPVSESLARMQKRVEHTGVEKDRFEQEHSQFHERVRRAYLELAQKSPRQWLVLDAMQSPEQLAEGFLKAMMDRKLLR